MVFKWFKARMEMNTMPAHSSAVSGSYRISAFDDPYNDFTRNNDQREADRQIKPESNLVQRPVSEPVLYDPMAEGSSREVSKPSRKKTAPKPMAKSEGELNRIVDDDGTKAETVQPNFNESMANRTPRPKPKLSKTEYKRKKVKAPAPKMKFSIDGTSKNRSTEFVTVKDKRKTSESSDFEV